MILNLKKNDLLLLVTNIVATNKDQFGHKAKKFSSDIHSLSLKCKQSDAEITHYRKQVKFHELPQFDMEKFKFL